MRRQDRLRIFEAFFQVDVSSSGSYTGSGLGLALAAALAESLGGSLSVRSDVGRGATFTFRLPATVVGS